MAFITRLMSTYCNLSGSPMTYYGKILRLLTLAMCFSRGCSSMSLPCCNKFVFMCSYWINSKNSLFFLICWWKFRSKQNFIFVFSIFSSIKLLTSLSFCSRSNGISFFLNSPWLSNYQSLISFNLYTISSLNLLMDPSLNLRLYSLDF
jgi:hypothetical protein